MIGLPGRAAIDGPAGQMHTMLAVDIVGYTRDDRNEDTRIYLHQTMSDILASAVQGSGIPWDECRIVDRGDGALIFIPPSIPVAPVVDPLPARLHALIRFRNQMAADPAKMQLRAAAHIGPVYASRHGLVGDDINYLCRMLDARPLRKALADTGAELAYAISDYMHHTVVLRHPSLINPAAYQPMKARVKRTRIHAWIHLPGMPADVDFLGA